MIQHSLQSPSHKERLQKSDSGSVLILTMWILVFLALLAAAIANTVAAHLQVVSDLKWSARSRGIGMRALADAIHLLKTDPMSSFDTLYESWASNEERFKNVPYGDGYFSIVYQGQESMADSVQQRYGFTDEEGKINLNRAPAPVLSLLLQMAGMTSAQADELALFIVDWRDENNTPEGISLGGVEVCRTLSLPFRCKDADFESLEELWWMPGMTAALYQAIAGELTVFGAGAVNANTATSVALRSLGLSAVGADRLILWRSEPGNFFENPSAIIGRLAETGIPEEDRIKLGSAVASGLVGTRSDFFRGEVHAEFGNRSRKVASFIVHRDGEVKGWRE